MPPVVSLFAGALFLCVALLPWGDGDRYQISDVLMAAGGGVAIGVGLATLRRQ